MEFALSAPKGGSFGQYTVQRNVPGEGAARSHYLRYASGCATQPAERLAQKRAEADALFHRVGITFAVYGQEEGAERLIPFDIVPRVLPRGGVDTPGARPEAARAGANAFIHDIYHEQQILKAGVDSRRTDPLQLAVPPGDAGRRRARAASTPTSPASTSCATTPGEYLVLEDNLRVPSGVSYMLENRKMMMRLFPELFAAHRIAPVDHYPDVLLDNLRSVAPDRRADPTVVLLTPGAYNSAYFEHAFLAQQMGIELVEGQDLFVHDDAVFMRTTQGPQRVDVIYRRIDDDFLDPLVFRPDSMLGVPGLFAAYRAGHVTLANAIGTGVADDKSIYPYVPGDDPLLPGPEADPQQRATPGCCASRRTCEYVLAHLDELVVKEVHGAGGYGMLIGPAGLDKRRSRSSAQQIIATPERYIAQPTLALSTCPTFADAGHRAAPHRPAAVRALGPRRHDRARRPDPRRAARRLAGRQLVAGRRHQGHLGAGELTC